MQSNHKKFMQTKGFYILLAALALVIGVSGYVFLSDASKEQKEVERAGVSSLAERLQEATQSAPVSQTMPPEETNLGHGAQEVTLMPVSGQVVQGYAMEQLMYNATTRDWRTHDGVDLAASVGTQVQAARKGTVLSVYEDEYYGMTVQLQHDGGYTTSYSGLSTDVSVKTGDTVAAGQVIGTVADTILLETALESHLHFSVCKDNEPVDPAGFLYQ